MDVDKIALKPTFKTSILLEAMRNANVSINKVKKAVSLLYRALVTNHIMPDVNYENVPEYIDLVADDYMESLEVHRASMSHKEFQQSLDNLETYLKHCLAYIYLTLANKMEDKLISGDVFKAYETGLQYIAFHRVLSIYRA